MLVGEIADAYKKLDGIKEKTLPIKVMFIISRNYKKFEEVAKDVDSKITDLMYKYAVKNDDGTYETDKDGNMIPSDYAAFNKEYSDLFSANVDITIDKFKLSDLEDADKDGYDKLTIEEMNALSIMITGDAEL